MKRLVVVSNPALRVLKKKAKQYGLTVKEEKEAGFTIVEMREEVFRLLEEMARREGLTLRDMLAKILNEF